MNDTKLADHREKVATRQGDLTQGPILRTLLTFSIPTLFANVLQAAGGTINTIWVGQLLGDKALAATANANMVMILAFSAVFGFGTAATIKIGQYIGAQDHDAARRILGAGTGFCTGLAIFGAAVGCLLADPMLRVLATPAAIHDDALIYLQVIFIGMPFATISMMISMGLRGAGDAKSPLNAMIVATVLGIALNPVLILGLGPAPRLGIAGSGLANLLASLGGIAVMMATMYLRDHPLRLRGREWSYLLPVRRELSYVVAKGLPMGAQMMISSAAGVIMVGLVNREGMMATAAYGAVMQIWGYIQMPAFALSTAVSAMVAQNIGAGRHDRVDPVTVAGVWANVWLTGLLTAALLLFDEPLFHLFLGSGSQAIPLAGHVQLVSTWAFILQGVTMVLTGTMRSYGAVMLPLIAMVVSMYPARLGFYAVMYPLIGAEAIWWSYPAGTATALLLTWMFYAKGNWRGEITAARAKAVPAE